MNTIESTIMATMQYQYKTINTNKTTQKQKQKNKKGDWLKMINQKQLEYLCRKYSIKYQYFEVTDIALLYTPLDTWQIKYVGNRDRPYCLLHKNKIKQTKKFHVQRYLRTLPQLIDSILRHKNVLSQIYISKIHKQNNNIKRKEVI